MFNPPRHGGAAGLDETRTRYIRPARSRGLLGAAWPPLFVEHFPAVAPRFSRTHSGPVATQSRDRRPTCGARDAPCL